MIQLMSQLYIITGCQCKTAVGKTMLLPWGTKERGGGGGEDGKGQGRPDGTLRLTRHEYVGSEAIVLITQLYMLLKSPCKLKSTKFRSRQVNYDNDSSHLTSTKTKHKEELYL